METLVRVLKHVGHFCLGAALLFLLTGVADVWMRRGIDAALELLRLDVVNVLVLALPFLPGGIFLMLSAMAAVRARKVAARGRRIPLGRRIHG